VEPVPSNDAPVVVIAPPVEPPPGLTRWDAMDAKLEDIKSRLEAMAERPIEAAADESADAVDTTADVVDVPVIAAEPAERKRKVKARVHGRRR